MYALKLRPEDIQVMYEHGEREYPHEACGVILADRSDPSKNVVLPCRNVQGELKEKDPEHFGRDADTGYFMDPKDVRSAFDRAAKEKLDVAGFYHSHPDHDVYWSAEDNRAAMWAGSDEPSFPDASNVVVSVFNGKAKNAAIFLWSAAEKAFLRHDL